MDSQKRFELKAVALFVNHGFSRTHRKDGCIIGSTHKDELSEVTPEIIRKYDLKVSALSQALRRTVALVYDPAQCVFSVHVPLTEKKPVRIRSRSIHRLGGAA